MFKANRIAKATVTAGLAFGLIAAGATAAQADPSGTGFRTYAAAGSDTIQDVYNGLSNGYTAGTTSVPAAAASIGSYDAFAATKPITTKTGGATFDRPAGSGDGVKALSASWNDAKRDFTDAAAQNWKLRGTNATTSDLSIHEIDIARSSSRPGTSVLPGGANDKLTFVPLARDAVSVAVQTVGLTGAPTDFTTAELKAIFTGGTSGRISQSGNNDPVYNGTITLHPELPQASSGTRSFFLKAIGQGTSPIGSWVEQINAPENSAVSLNDAGDVSPFSAGQWIAQKNGIATSTFSASNASTLTISSVNSLSAVQGSPLVPGMLYGSLTAEPSSAAGNFARDVYSVVPTANNTGEFNTLLTVTLRNARYGFGAALKYVVNDFGFGRIDYTAGEGEYHSNWTN